MFLKSLPTRILLSSLICGDAAAQSRGQPTFDKINKVAPVYSLRDDSGPSPNTAGTGYNPADVITLDDGCSTHATIAVSTTASGPPGPVATYTITNRGLCFTAPNSPVAQLSSTGAGTGFSINSTYGWLASALDYGTLPINLGNTFLANPAITPQPNFAGTESTFVGYGAGGGFVGVSSFNTAVGHNALGIGGTHGTGGSNTAVGTDTIRNYSGGSLLTAFGTSALHDLNLAPNNITAIGANAFRYLNNGNGGNNSVGLGGNACPGANGTATFVHITCIGAATGNAMTTAINVTLLGTNIGNTITTGNNVLLIGTGSVALEPPAPTTLGYLSIQNAIIGALNAPTINSGFGTSPTISGNSSFAFQVTVGSGGVASSGVVNLTVIVGTGYLCDAQNQTNPATSVMSSVIASTFSVTIQNYSRTTGAVTPWTAGDVLNIRCNAL